MAEGLSKRSREQSTNGLGNRRGLALRLKDMPPVGHALLDKVDMGPHSWAMTDRTTFVGPEAYLPRYQLLLDDIERDLAELAETRRLGRSSVLSKSTGQHFNNNELPMVLHRRSRCDIRARSTESEAR
jgi:hypothetical protein